MTVTTAALPPESLLTGFRRAGDYVDCFGADGLPEGLTPLQAAEHMVGTMPNWVGWLMAVRHALVAPFGLKVSVPDRSGASDAKVGGRVGFFKIYHIGEDEVVLGEDDKHLDFRLSVFYGAEGVRLATWVGPHNRLGRLYLATVLPFHKLIVRGMLSRLMVRA